MREPVFGMRVLCDLPLYIPASYIWLLIWLFVSAAVLTKASRSRPNYRYRYLLLWIALASLGFTACRLQSYLPLGRIWMAILPSLAAALLAVTMARAMLGRLTYGQALGLFIGISSLCLPILFGLYVVAKHQEQIPIVVASNNLRLFQRALKAYRMVEGHYPPQVGWQEMNPYIDKAQGGVHVVLSSWDWQAFVYKKPKGDLPGSQVIAYVLIEAGEIIPGQKIMVTLDGKVSSERMDSQREPRRGPSP